ncbi:MAG: D-aminoacylase [Chloroflexota bacterium]|nr:D-aminoacylase [Chloroflexota bacterium]
MDTWIVNGMVVDGTGAPRRRADLRIVDGIIADVVEGGGSAHERQGPCIDAEGLVVAPGFIDLHSHSDVALLVDPVVPSKLNQGITLEVLGQDGMSVAPLTDATADPWRRHLSGLAGSYDIPWDWRTFENYLDRFGPTAANVAVLVGHGTLRLNVIGMADRPATSTELDRMSWLLREALASGAFGLSGGLVYTPGSYGTYEELVALNRIVVEANKLWMVHIRYEGDRIAEGLDEMFRLVEETGVSLHISHFKALGRSNWGRGPEIVERVERQRQQGMDVTVDQYPYTAGSTMLSAVLPPWAHAEGPERLLQLLHDAEAVAQMEADIDSGLPGWEGFVNSIGWDNVRISDVGESNHVELVGRSVTEIADLWHSPPFQAAVRLLIEGDLAVSMVVHAMHEDDVTAIMRAPWRMGGTDALLGGKPHPRSYGSYPRVLGHYARERGIISLEEAVRQMTGAAARRLRLTDRGSIEIGKRADLCLFDPDRVRDRATFAEPEQLPDGIAWVMVNGEPVLHDHEPTGKLPGSILRQQ